MATVRQPKTFVKNTTITNAPPSAIDGNTTSVRAQQHLGGDGEIQREEKKGKVQKHTHTEDPVEIYENFLDFCDWGRRVLDGREVLFKKKKTFTTKKSNTLRWWWIWKP